MDFGGGDSFPYDRARARLLASRPPRVSSCNRKSPAGNGRASPLFPCGLTCAACARGPVSSNDHTEDSGNKSVHRVVVACRTIYAARTAAGFCGRRVPKSPVPAVRLALLLAEPRELRRRSRCMSSKHQGIRQSAKFKPSSLWQSSCDLSVTVSLD